MRYARTRRNGPNFFKLWALFGMAAPLAGAGVLGLDLETTVYVAAGGLLLAAIIASDGLFRIESGHGDLDIVDHYAADGSSDADGGWSWGGDGDGGGGSCGDDGGE